MPSDSYSFLDVAVLEPVRQRFAAGDALAILSVDLEQVIWANGPGATLLGYPDIETVIGASAGLPPIARRQIMATSGFPDIGGNRAILVRLATGVASQAVAFQASAVVMPDGEKAILLAASATGSGAADPAAIASRAIGGFTEGGHFIAFIDGDGHIEAASDGFSALAISQQTLAALVADVADEHGRIVKRLLPGSAGSYPAGFARLTDDPARHLLVVIDEGSLGDAAPSPRRDEEAAGPATEPDAAPATKTGAFDPFSTDAEPGESDHPGNTGESASHHDRWYFNAENETFSQPSKPHPLEPSQATPATAPLSDRETEEPPSAPASENVPGTDQPSATPPADPSDMPAVRFVWRTDADGKFSVVSPEFASAVGQPAADIIGRPFKEVAAVFGFDPSGEIAGLLERRDTWSGRSVLWPVAGTDLAVPVDLAALPVYDRNRIFEGFRGFGVARSKDAVKDPQGIGLTLTQAAEQAEPPAPVPPEADPFEGEVPALTITPKPERRFTDKVIRLAEHRQLASDRSLSSLERSAFREIGERLKKDSETNEDVTQERPAVPMEPEAGKVEPPSQEEPAQPTAGIDADDPAVTDQPKAIEPEAARKTELPETVEETGPHSATDEPSGDTTPALVDEQEAPQAIDPTRVGEADVPETAPTRTPSPGTADNSPSATAASGDAGPDTSILSKLPVPLLFHAGDRLHFANDEFLRLTGYATLAELEQAGGLGALFADPYTQENAPDGSAGRMLRLKTREGHEFPIEAILRSVPWGDGKALVLLVRRTGDAEPQQVPEPVAPPPSEPVPPAQPDIADLKARIAEMRTIIDTATDGVVLIDRDGTIRSISRPAEALFSFDSDEVAGKPFISLFAIESQKAARDYLSGLSDNGVASVLNDGREVIGREAQGRFIPLFMTIGRLPNDSGFCAVVRDITQWKRAEEDLTQARAVAERASSQKTDFLARISHEIRTPLNAIIGFSELMVDEKFGPIANDRYRDYLRDINRSGNHVLDLVNDLLDISKIEAGQQEMDYEAVSLNDTLAETVAMMQPQANRERVIIRSSFASKLPEVVADLRSVRQIALNILSNAIRYTQAGGQVIVSTAYETSGDVVIRVRDTGIGMSQAEIEQALKPFKQINALKRGRNDGTGLGLPLTKAMVEANRARFTINSTPGEGTLVEVAFPSTRVLAE